jgi:hypothetical protein
MAPETFLACRLLYTLFKKDREGGNMKYYMANYTGSVSEGMNYKQQGSGNELYLLFPELKAVISRYPFKAIDIRLTNGDRLRIYDINKNKRQNTSNTTQKYIPQIMEEMTNEKRTFINS